MGRLTTRVRFASLIVAGVTVGIVGAAIAAGDGDDTTSRAVVPSTTPATQTSTTSTTSTTTTRAVSEPSGPLLVWTSGGLASGLDAAIGTVAGVTDVAVVRGDDVELVASFDAAGVQVDAPAPGWFIPVDALAVDPETYGLVVPGGEVIAEALVARGSAVLGETSAALRRIGVGGAVELTGGRRLVVTAVVPDDVVAAAELMVSIETGAEIGIDTRRSALVRYQGDRAVIEREIAALMPDRPLPRFRQRGETAFLRHGDAVLPQAMIKARFGEFSARGAGGTALELDPVWVQANIVEADLPLLGRATCHREFVEMLEGALRELTEDGLATLVDPSQFAGCYSPRRIGPGLGISRHAWGVAADVNAASNPLGAPGTQDDRLVTIMRRWGMAWGGEWLRPDPMHFEYLGGRR